MNEDIMGPNGPIEPSAEMRDAAKQLLHFHVALRKEGFNEAQALHIIGLSMSAAMSNQQPEEG